MNPHFKKSIWIASLCFGLLLSGIALSESHLNQSQQDQEKRQDQNENSPLLEAYIKDPEGAVAQLIKDRNPNGLRELADYLEDKDPKRADELRKEAENLEQTLTLEEERSESRVGSPVSLTTPTRSSQQKVFEDDPQTKEKQVRSWVEALRNHSTNRDKMRRVIFDPRRVEPIHLKNGVSILPIGKDEAPVVITTREFQRQQQEAFKKVGIEVDAKEGGFILPEEFDLSQLSEGELQLTGLEKLSKETRPSALSNGEVLLPQGNGKFKVVDGQAYVASRKAELDIVASAGILMRGLEFAGFKEDGEKGPKFFSRLTEAIQDNHSGLHQALEKLYPGFSEQVLVEAAFGKHFGEQSEKDSDRVLDLPKESPENPELARLWELAIKERDLRKRLQLPLGRTGMDPKVREAREREHRDTVANWGREALRISAQGIDPSAYAPPALQSHLKRLAGFTQDTAKISASNLAAQENMQLARASFVEDLADLTRVINSARREKKGRGYITRNAPARIEVFSHGNPPPPTTQGRFLESESDKVSARYNDVFHKLNGPKVSSDTTTFSNLEIRQYVRQKANNVQGQATRLLEVAEIYFGGRWAQNQFWFPGASREIDESLSRNLTNIWKETRAVAKQAEKDPRLKPFSDSLTENFKSLERIQDKPQELASKYTRDVVANSAAAIVTVSTMGAGSLLFGIGQAGKVLTLAEVGQAAVVGGTVSTVTHVADVGLRRWVDGDKTATLTAGGISLAAVQGAGMGVVSRLAPGVGDVLGAYYGYQGTLVSANAAMDGNYGAAMSEGLSTLGTMAALKYIGTRSKGTAQKEPPATGESFWKTEFANLGAVIDPLLNSPVAVPGDPSIRFVRRLSSGRSPAETSELSLEQAQLPKTEGERFLATKKSAINILGEELADSRLGRIQEIVEDAHRSDLSEVGKDGTPVRHGNYTDAQILRKFRSISTRLETELGIPKEQARALAKKVIQDGAAGRARENDFTDAYRNGDVEDIEEPKKTTHKNRAGGGSDLDEVNRISSGEGLTAEQRQELGVRIHEVKTWLTDERFRDHKGDLEAEVIRELARSVRDKREFDPANIQTKEDRQTAQARKKREKIKEREAKRLLEESRPIAGEEIARSGSEISSPPVARQLLQATVIRTAADLPAIPKGSVRLTHFTGDQRFARAITEGEDFDYSRYEGINRKTDDFWDNQAVWQTIQSGAKAGFGRSPFGHLVVLLDVPETEWKIHRSFNPDRTFDSFGTVSNDRILGVVNRTTGEFTPNPNYNPAPVPLPPAGPRTYKPNKPNEVTPDTVSEDSWVEFPSSSEPRPGNNPAQASQDSYEDWL